MRRHLECGAWTTSAICIGAAVGAFGEIASTANFGYANAYYMEKPANYRTTSTLTNSQHSSTRRKTAAAPALVDKRFQADPRRKDIARQLPEMTTRP